MCLTSTELAIIICNHLTILFLYANIPIMRLIANDSYDVAYCSNSGDDICSMKRSRYRK